MIVSLSKEGFARICAYVDYNRLGVECCVGDRTAFGYDEVIDHPRFVSNGLSRMTDLQPGSRWRIADRLAIAPWLGNGKLHDALMNLAAESLQRITADAEPEVLGQGMHDKPGSVVE